jgi:hypothetical protein
MILVGEGNYIASASNLIYFRSGPTVKSYVTTFIVYQYFIFLDNSGKSFIVQLALLQAINDGIRKLIRHLQRRR